MLFPFTMHKHAHTTLGHYSLYFAVGITLSFALIEAGAGWWSNSLALMSDAGHMLVDTSALLIASFGVWFAHRTSTHRFSYGFGQAEFIAAFCNGLLMLAVVSGVIYHAVNACPSLSVVNYNFLLENRHLFVLAPNNRLP